MCRPWWSGTNRGGYVRTDLISEHQNSPMALWEVWEYGYGDGGRIRYRAPSADKAVKAFLERRVASGLMFREFLEEKGQEKVKVCVKDPRKEGTRESPNYPSVHTFQLRKEWVES